MKYKIFCPRYGHDPYRKQFLNLGCTSELHHLVSEPSNPSAASFSHMIKEQKEYPSIKARVETLEKAVQDIQNTFKDNKEGSITEFRTCIKNRDEEQSCDTHGKHKFTSPPSSSNVEETRHQNQHNHSPSKGQKHADLTTSQLQYTREITGQHMENFNNCGQEVFGK